MNEEAPLLKAVFDDGLIRNFEGLRDVSRRIKSQSLRRLNREIRG